jgi:LmbE family N-acetylglucosaminyl deacetylase
VTRLILNTVSVVLAALLVLTLAGLVIGRMMFAEPGVPEIRSVRAALEADRILFVFAHPDDEILVTELIARAVDEGIEVTTLTATRGEGGTQYPPLVDQQYLGVVREAELRRHGFALGVTRQIVLGLPDGGVPDTPDAELAGMVRAVIGEVRPDVIVGFHPASGISMHPDHRAMGRAAELAAGDIPLLYVLGPRPGFRRFGGEAQRQVADLQPEPDFAINADPRLKLRAWNIHQSQTRYIQGTAGLPAWVLYSLWRQEYYAWAEEEGMR